MPAKGKKDTGAEKTAQGAQNTRQEVGTTVAGPKGLEEVILQCHGFCDTTAKALGVPAIQEARTPSPIYMPTTESPKRRCAPTGDACQATDSVPDWVTDRTEVGVDEEDEDMPFEEPYALDPNEESVPQWVPEPMVPDDVALEPNKASPLGPTAPVEPLTG
ncbi:UNVERIFIED_CONTAM: hypothetical protein K2H54_008784 [Gekko kuhli]